MERLDVTGAQGGAPFLLMEKPEGVSGGGHAALVWLHGGGWRYGSAYQYARHMALSAEYGAVAFSIDYRLQSDTVQVADCLYDCRQAISFLRKHAKELGIDPSRIIAAGESAGGHLACCLGTPGIVKDKSERADYVVNVNGVVDMTRVFKQHLCKPDTEDADRWISQQKAAQALSPLYMVSGDCAPALHVQGLSDTVVEPEMTWQYHQALLAAGVSSSLLMIPGYRHAFLVLDYEMDNSLVEETVRMILSRLIAMGWLKQPATCHNDPQQR